MPTLLALDCATDTLHIGLMLSSSPATLHLNKIVSRALPGGMQASALALPTLDAFLHDQAISWSMVAAIAFGQGPGAFTGLRTAAAITQGLALGLGKPVLALNTLQAIAEDARYQYTMGQPEPEPILIWSLLDARMGELYAAPFHYAAGTWSQIAAAQLLQPQQWLDSCQSDEYLAAFSSMHQPPTQLVAGNGLLTYPTLLTALPTDMRPYPHAAPTGYALTTLAEAAWQAGQLGDPAQALPTYVRNKVAQTVLEREMLRAQTQPPTPATA